MSSFFHFVSPKKKQNQASWHFLRLQPAASAASFLRLVGARLYGSHPGQEEDMMEVPSVQASKPKWQQLHAYA